MPLGTLKNRETDNLYFLRLPTNPLLHHNTFITGTSDSVLVLIFESDWIITRYNIC